MAELLARFGLAAALVLVFAASAQAANIGRVESVRWSWYGGPRDSGDNDRSASGITNRLPGIARYDQSTLKGYFVVGHGGEKWLLQQTDIGPHPRTGRGVDINYSAVPLFGYHEGNFPTDSRASVTYVGKDLAGARRRALAMGARIPGYRAYGGAAGQAPAARAPAGSTAAAAPASADLLGLMLGALGGQQGPQPVPVTAPQMPSFAARPPWLS